MAEIQTQVSVSIVAAAEGTFGTAALAGAADAKRIRRVGSTLNIGKDAYTSAEVRNDQQIADMRHGTRRAAGGIEGELSIGSYDQFLEAVLRGTWAAGDVMSEVEFTSVTGDAAASTLTLGGGDPIAEGVRVGDVIRLTGSGIPAADRTVNYRVTGFSGTNNRVVAVSPAPTTYAAVNVFGLAVAGKKVLVGTQRRSFTLEQVYPEVDASELFVGMRVGAAALRLPPTGMATISLDFQGTNGTLLKGAASPYFSAPADQTTGSVLAAVNGALRVRDKDVAIVTGLDLAVNLNLSSQPVVGSNFVPDIFYGVTTLTGNLSAYFDSTELMEAFLNEEEFDIVGVFEAATGSPKDFIAFNMQRVKFTGNSKSIGADGGVILSLPFQALLNQQASNSGFDVSTLAIQTSAAL